ncbi:MAG: carboxypeptidase-like regulatory domain-containing protein [Isosphaeraceae bacterium]
MRVIGLRLPLLAVIALGLCVGTSRAAEVLYLETADWYPTASVFVLPTSYAAASAYVVPTSTVIPTAYATAYVTESAFYTPTVSWGSTYYETRFRRRGLLGRRLVETTRSYYIPTTAYYPTTYYYSYTPTSFWAPALVDTAVLPAEYAVASTAATSCCSEVATSAAPVVRTYASEQAPATAAPAPRSGTRRRQQPLQSEPADEDSIDSNVPVGPRQTGPKLAQPKAADGQGQPEATPPAPTPPPRGQQTTVPRPDTPATPTMSKPGGFLGSAPATRNPAGGTSPAKDITGAGADVQSKINDGRIPPVAPSEVGTGTANELPLPAPLGPDDVLTAPPENQNPSGGPTRRENLRPRFTSPRNLPPELRNILFGTVKARGSSEPEEGVQVTISSRTNAFVDRAKLTDEDGRFAIQVPDGDWTVKVTMPSGRVYPVSQITVSNGMITDDIGRDIPSLIITR